MAASNIPEALCANPLQPPAAVDTTSPESRNGTTSQFGIRRLRRSEMSATVMTRIVGHQATECMKPSHAQFEAHSEGGQRVKAQRVIARPLERVSTVVYTCNGCVTDEAFHNLWAAWGILWACCRSQDAARRILPHPATLPKRCFVASFAGSRLPRGYVRKRGQLRQTVLVWRVNCVNGYAPYPWGRTDLK